MTKVNLPVPASLLPTQAYSHFSFAYASILIPILFTCMGQGAGA